ncbi:MAG: type I-F CRISPR-associated helicase Cas3f [Xanthomonadaceae bacterium]|nr:type I-F CRISPR-associated helicase Cas3f [Xanthomonadaceae bacterium]MDP2186554.1 type I-F CRISPR-associated helicase Cas3f [Xanthomonadales bacterium]MDZ4116234.1 type I-F CRISPR-associated helicase Cas3f [Xanthomonadaceae bacterium]MDZ4376722.1 type I-F CRISPR-associated helicase Cas3f [Xanthomonadaceae bacterium]
MNILLISQCDKRALSETRRILDQFGERRGDRTWQTPITQDGLATLRRLLRKTARKNTAVACHWIRGHDHSELLWIVGDARRFNAEGAVPTNTTQRNILRQADENDWHSLQVIHLLSGLAALLHDLGKACKAFQDRLVADSPGKPERNQYRHEWISLRLFQAFVGDATDDQGWLHRLHAPSVNDDSSWLDRLCRDGIDPAAEKNSPLANMPPLARTVGWLVLTHHRLPVQPPRQDDPPWLGAKLSSFRSSQLENLLDRIDCNWNELPTSTDKAVVAPYWTFPHGLPVTTPTWRKRATRFARHLIEHAAQPDGRDWLDDPYVMHLSRLSLMLADHHYSSLTNTADRVKGEANYPLHANTAQDKNGRRNLNQTLDEHLLGVEKHAGIVTHALPDFATKLPRLCRHKGLRKRSADARFRWQDRASDTAVTMRERGARHGAFIVNMASTGCGKTLANARIMNALADPAQGMRCAFAMGLRTLTLLTGRAFRDLLSLDDEDLAIQAGGAANRELFEHYAELAEQSGSASAQTLLPEDGHVRFEGNAEHALLQRLTPEPQPRKLLSAPILVCTIDHLTPATESQRGGRQIIPMLRLMSGDLVLDEPDDFDIDDLPALTRLVHWAGLLGSRVLLSSATLPPALVEGLFAAYLDGRRWFARNRGQRHDESPAVCCAWFDEFAQAQHDCAEADGFRDAHLAFAQSRHAQLGKQDARRRSELLPMAFKSTDTGTIRTEFAGLIRDAALRLHDTHRSIDPHSGKRVSFGLVRMANIDPLFDVALALYALGAPEGKRIHLCVYHSQFPLLIRSAIEHRLDSALDRRRPDAVFDLADIRQRLDAHPESDQLFVVLGSPVTEVGRDHDYDWGVVEPSSMRSLIQLAGRIRRHRDGVMEHPNLLIFDHNLRHFEHSGGPAFCKPGFETGEPAFKLTTHTLEKLLDAAEREAIDARPRIMARPDDTLRPKDRLVDLEHARLDRQMQTQQSKFPDLSARERRSGASAAPQWPPINAASHWQRQHASLTAVLPQQQPFRFDPVPRIDLVLLPNDDEDDFVLHYVADGARRWEKLYVTIDGKINLLPDTAVQGQRMVPWGSHDFMQLLREHAEIFDLSPSDCAKRFATVSIPDATQGWRFHPLLGFTRKK